MTALIYRRSPWRVWPSIWKPAFLKHLHNLAISDFYAPDLDADDYAFLEQVRVRGSANSSLPETGVASLEELDFWQQPYTMERGVIRRAGPVQRRQELPEERELRLARRVLRGSRKAIADAEMERERREQQAAKANRVRREVLDDMEWRHAAPRSKRSRHYVPVWGLEAQRQAQAQAEEHARLLALEAEAKQERRRQAADKARSTVERLERPAYHDPGNSTRAELKRAIMTLVRSTIPVPWEEDDLARAVGCTRQVLDVLTEEMLHDGHLRNVPSQARAR